MINDLWYKNAIIYCLSVGTYMDANGDGIGDFQGLMRRLDYLHGLGVTAIWLMPFQPSPGTRRRLRHLRLLRRRSALRHARRLRRVHPRLPSSAASASSSTSSSTTPPTSIPGSRRRAAIQDSKYRDWYVWSDKKPANANKGMVFPGVQKSTWTLRQGGQAPGTSTASTISSPTSTPRNPQVQAEILKIMGFWIQLGVSGFRMDAVPFVIATKGAERAASRSSNTTCCAPSASSCSGARATPSSWPRPTCCPKTDMEYFGDDGDRMHMMFNFQVNQNLFYALAAARHPAAGQGAAGDQAAARHRAMGPVPAQPRRARSRPAHRRAARRRCSTAFGPDKDMQLYDRGIRRRLAPMLGGDRRRLELAYSLMFTLPGTPVHPLRRRARHGRRSAPAGAQLRAHADAVVDRAAWRLHQERQAAFAR